MMRIETRRKKPYRFLVWLIVLGVIFYFGFGKLFKLKSNISFQVNDPQAKKPLLISPSPIQEKSKSLKEAVQRALEDTKGTYGVVVKNFKTGESFYSNEHQVFEAGSLYKLWIMAAVYKEIQDLSLKEDEVLSEDVTILNNKFNIDPELVEMKDGTITLPVNQALNQMITISHNYAALLLIEKIKLSTVTSFLDANNLNESKVGTNGEAPTTTPSDIAAFLEKLYKGELGSKQYTDKMINILKNQQLNDKLPKYLPENVVIAHKTGELDYYSHDAGIVYTPGEDYLVVVLSKSDSPIGAEDRIALLSKAVYDYFLTH